MGVPADVRKTPRRLIRPTLVLSGEKSDIFTTISRKVFRKADTPVKLKSIHRPFFREPGQSSNI